MEGIWAMRNLTPDLAIIPVKIKQRPFSGLAGNIDWICGGILSKLIKDGKVSETDGEVLMYSNLKKFPFPLVFAFFDGSQSLSATVQKVIKNIGVKRVFLDISNSEDIDIEGDVDIIKYTKL